MNVQRLSRSTQPGSEQWDRSGLSRDLLRLPFVATIVQMEEDRGFGFARCEAVGADLFFHVKGNQSGLQEFPDMAKGDLLLCQVGSRSQDPGRPCIVLWQNARDMGAEGQDVPECQGDLDAVRRVALAERSLNQLRQQIAAQWYDRRWNGTPPADLRDPILGAAWIERLAGLSPDALGRTAIGAQTVPCRYDFGAWIDPASTGCRVGLLLERFTPAQLAVLGSPQKQWLAPVPGVGPSEWEARNAALLAWFLEAGGATAPASDLDAWLPGRHGYEGIVAQRLLERGDPLAAPVRQWMVALVGHGLLGDSGIERLVATAPETAGPLFGRLSAEARDEVIAAWHQDPLPLARALDERPDLVDEVARHSMLAVDLESDGDRIREIGCAGAGAPARLHDERAGTDLAVALAELEARIGRARVVVGHNILAWDWPILATRMPACPQPPVWDTLLVEFLIDPAATSHALGGTHRAEADAVATLDLVVTQLRRLPSVLAARVLSGGLNTPEALLAAVCNGLANSPVSTRPQPAILNDPDRDPARLLLMPEAELRQLFWVPGIAVVQADPQEILPQPFWQIDAGRLAAEIAVDASRDPRAQVLQALCRRAMAAGVVLYRGMLPPWLLEGSTGLAAAVDRACELPGPTGQLCAAPLPQTTDGWGRAAALGQRAVLPLGQVVVVDRARADAAAVAVDGQLPDAALVRLPGTGADRWVVRDRAAQMLELRAGGTLFRTLRVPAAIAAVDLPARAKLPAPILVKRGHAALFPGAQDQAGYWTDLLATFRGCAAGDGVPVLLVGSTRSAALIALLATALAEVGMAEIQPDHRSRREHLRRAAARGLVIVAPLAAWRDWQALAEGTGVVLSPIVESLPVEEWFALSQTMSAAGTVASSDLSSTSLPALPAAPTVVADGQLLAALPRLADEFLGPWLAATGLDTAAQSPTILDARADAVGQQLRAHMKPLPLAGKGWPAEALGRLRAVLGPLGIQRAEAPSDPATLEAFLVKHWQPAGASGGNSVTGFKPVQAQAIEAIRRRDRDVVVTLPTGEGKSVLFQVPALCRGLRNRRLTLVLSPLKALMKDQVARLQDQGFADSADYLSSDRPLHELTEVLQGVLDHRIVLLYVAPERLRSALFADVLRRRIAADGGLEYLVFDEAHCINQWGHDFRPDYLHALNWLLRELRGGAWPEATPFLFLSATLTASDRRSLGLVLDSGTQGAARLERQICPDPAEAALPVRSHIGIEPVAMRGNILDRKAYATVLDERLDRIVEVIAEARANRAATGQRSAVLVFVTRRAHAEDLAGRLAELCGCPVESFHAGLDGATRDDIYSRFRGGALDVLVATKAFGMGMDIPDIHWVVHLSPPGCLDDYLQEVGRIGRGEIERQRAGLDRLRAIMLASPADFEKIRSQRAQNEVRPPQIDEIETQILSVAEGVAGQRVAIVPAHGLAPNESASDQKANTMTLRTALYWLERAGHLTQLGIVPNLLSAKVFPARLAAVAEEESGQGQLAKAILELTQDDDPEDPDSGERPQERLLRRLADGPGLWLGPVQGAVPPRRRSMAPERARINLAWLRDRCLISSHDETMAGLVALQTRGAIKLDWTLVISTRPLLGEAPPSVELLMAAVEGAVQALLRQLARRGSVVFDPIAHMDDPDWGLAVPDGAPPPTEKEVEGLKRSQERLTRAYLAGVRTLARAVGIRMRQVLRKADQGLDWLFELPEVQRGAATVRCRALMSMARALLSLFLKAETPKEFQVDVHALIEAMSKANPRRPFRRSDLEALLRLLVAMHLISAQPDLVPMSYVLALSDHPPGMDQHPELVQELNEVHVLSQARGDAMEIFANLPEPAREPFIRGYLAQASGSDLKTFLDSQLDEIPEDDENTRGFIARKREALRATMATAFFERYEKSEEPAQWQAIRHPFDRHLLVNAGPGAGKTSVLVGRIVHLIRMQHVKPGDILVLAFNRAVVFEIRKRIRALFRSLGYAAYATQVRVHTFHALARMSLRHEDETSAGFDSLLARFATRLHDEAPFREQVAGRCRSILVDEFQDVSDEIYAILSGLHLGSGQRAGVMVIGDDDQDIMGWDRTNARSGRGEPAEASFRRFARDFGGEDLQMLELSVNFRSGAAIVERSQAMIAGCFRAHPGARLKTTLLRPAAAAAESDCLALDAREWTREQTLDWVVKTSQRLRAESAGSLAVLCRTNAEVAQVHRHLVPHIPGLTVQSSNNLRIADLRHVGLWCDTLEAEIAGSDRPLTAPLLRRLIGNFRATTDIPEAAAETMPLADLAELWELCAQESVFPHLSTLRQFIRELKQDELLRLRGGRPEGRDCVVSTIHKVKGLEFDSVVVLPSRSAFPLGHKARQFIPDEAAVEARLMYVALTRAKKRLVYAKGRREYTWAGSSPKHCKSDAAPGQLLTGAHDEIALSWAMRRSYFNPDPDDCQAYLERRVRIGDPVQLAGVGQRANMALLHDDGSGRERQIGLLAAKIGAGSRLSDLKVSAVIRYPADRQSSGETDALVARRGWGYAVLVEGRLR